MANTNPTLEQLTSFSRSTPGAKRPGVQAEAYLLLIRTGTRKPAPWIRQQMAVQNTRTPIRVSSSILIRRAAAPVSLSMLMNLDASAITIRATAIWAAAWRNTTPTSPPMPPTLPQARIRRWGRGSSFLDVPLWQQKRLSLISPTALSSARSLATTRSRVFSISSTYLLDPNWSSSTTKRLRMQFLRMPKRAYRPNPTFLISKIALPVCMSPAH